MSPVQSARSSLLSFKITAATLLWKHFGITLLQTEELDPIVASELLDLIESMDKGITFQMNTQKMKR